MPARPQTVPRGILLAACIAAVAAGGCRRHSEGQTALLVELSTDGPVDCIVLTESAGGGAPLTQQIDRAAGLPDAFTGPAFRGARFSALVYAGGALGSGVVSVAAEGRRGGCGGTAAARASDLAGRFVDGEVQSLEAHLKLLGVDADGDGWAAPEDCNDNDPTIYPGAPELCDGKDHSCSGVIDQGCPCSGAASRACYPPGLSSPTLGVGICRAGAQACVGGKWDRACLGAVIPQAESCNGLDNDCDGTIGLPSCPCTQGATRRCFTKGPTALAGVGRCKWGTQSCGSDGFYGACAGDVGPLPYELCNGVDDNCDGTVDEEVDKGGQPVMVRPACAKDSGVCAGAQAHCDPAGSGAFLACTAADYSAAAAKNGSSYGPDARFCDGVDHDCDGAVDTGCTGACPQAGATRDCYGPGLGSPTLQHSPCKKGTQTCSTVNGSLTWSACAGEHVPSPEVCNGLDDDCNGRVDDLVEGEGKSCATGLPGVCADGYRDCRQGALGCVPLTAAAQELCDGLDNDCNGQIDELWNKQSDPQHCGGTFTCVACAPGGACCGGRCADTQSDPLNCGTCGHACGAGSGCCAGACTDLSGASDCGSCGHACAAGLVCAGGQCAPGRETDCANGVDDNHNGLTDCEDPDCDHQKCDQRGGNCQNRVCAHETNCADGLDNDGDGKIDCADEECLGQRCAGHGVCLASGACVVEQCHNGVDDNGDGLIDCQDALACPAPAGEAKPLCCGVAWTDAASDVANCGACGNDCRAGHSGECGAIACVKGACTYGSLPDRSSCSAGVCCRGNCVADREICSNGVDDNCDGKIDCEDALACPPPGGPGQFACCLPAGWVDLDHGDPRNCGACGRRCPLPPGSCQVAACAPGGVCGTVTDCTQPGCDGASCSANGKASLCAGGTCCAGCVAADGTCQGGTGLHACASASGACADCQPSNNPCVTDQCTAAGCTHVNNDNACTDPAGNPGLCHGGACCAGCIDGSGACQPIDANHCGTVGGACLPHACASGNACATDACDAATGTCTSTPLGDGAACTDGAASGVCEGGACCLGCVSGSACLSGAGESASACGLGGAACAACPPAPDCKVPACSGGKCATTNAPDGTSCTGGGTCAGGLCVAPCAGNKCGTACCGPGEGCNGNNVCTCDAAACGAVAGCCTGASPSRCIAAGPESCTGACAANSGGGSAKFCPGASATAGGKCVSGCRGNCGGANVTCGGATCLVSGAKSTTDVCSADGVHPEACDDIFNGVAELCTCDANNAPGTCPAPAPNTVCAPGSFGGGPFCTQCGQGFFNTAGALCAGGGTCKRTGNSWACQ